MEKSTRMYSEGKRIQGAPKIDVQYGIYRQMHYREFIWQNGAVRNYCADESRHG